MTIVCESIVDLATICAQLARECIQFEAHQSDLTITLTGGY